MREARIAQLTKTVGQLQLFLNGCMVEIQGRVLAPRLGVKAWFEKASFSSFLLVLLFKNAGLAQSIEHCSQGRGRRFESGLPLTVILWPDS